MARKARAVVGESESGGEYKCVEIEGQPFDALREPHVDAPARRPYVFRADLLRDMRIAVAERINTMLTGPTGCIAGDAEICVNRGGKGFRIKLADLVKMQNGGVNGGRRWDREISTQVQQARDGLVRLQAVTAAMYSGEKLTYRLRTKSGREIRATADHRFMLADGSWRMLCELKAGDAVCVKGAREPAAKWKKQTYRQRHGLFQHPYATHGRQTAKRDGWRVAEHRLVAEAALNSVSLDDFVQKLRGKQPADFTFLDPAVFAVHHKDEQPANNDLDNLEIMTHTAHRKLHADNALRAGAIPVVADIVKEIKRHKVESVYDLSMLDEPNFIANAFVVHNCGKTSLPLALAAELGYPVLRINLNGETRVTHLVGLQKPAAEDGVLTLKFAPGVLAKAMREGYWLILDEIDAATSNVLMTLQPVLEDRPSLYIPETGEHISHGHGLHPRFHVFATGNTIGYRSFTRARHAGTTPLNTALLDRFGMVIAVDYSDRASEFEVIRCNVPDCTPDFVEGICRVAEEIRIDSNFKADFSTRRLIQWARLLPLYDYDVLRVADLAIARKLETATDAKVFREITRRVFGYENEA